MGPNYNKPWEFFDAADLARTVERAYAAVEQAYAAAAGATPTEQALIGALRARYPQSRAVDDCSVWNEPYADAMRAVYELAPDDPDVAALYADALINLTPWQLWDIRTGRPAARARTLEAKAVLDRAIAAAAGDDHPGVLHMYIHLMEMSPTLAGGISRPRSEANWPVWRMWRCARFRVCRLLRARRGACQATRSAGLATEA